MIHNQMVVKLAASINEKPKIFFIGKVRMKLKIIPNWPYSLV